MFYFKIQGYKAFISNSIVTRYFEQTKQGIGIKEFKKNGAP